MKTLLILRHAKSAWDQPGLRDHDRPLNPRGRRDAPRMGRLLVERDLVPERIVSSTAVRARTTAALAASEFGGEREVEIETTGDLYHASPDAYIEVVEAMGGAEERLMVVGHNPGITSLVRHLTGEGEYMPTAALAAVELDIDEWSELGTARRGRLAGFWRPRAL